MIPYWTDEIDLHLVTFTKRTQLLASPELGDVRHTGLVASGHKDLARELLALVRDQKPDLIHTTLFDADILGRLVGMRCRIPVSSSLVNLNYGPEQRARPGQRKSTLYGAQLVDMGSARAVSRFHALTKSVADTMAARLLIRRSRVEVIPRGRERCVLGARTTERRAKVRRVLDIGSGPLLIAAARHEYQKGLDVLIRAVPLVLAAFPDTRILVGGRTGLKQMH